MNGSDLVLVWASAVGSGTWAHWRDACTYAGVDGASRLASTAAILGLMEWDWAAAPARFAATRPAVVALSGLPDVGLVVASAPGLCSRVRAMLHGTAGVFEIERPNGGPTSVGLRSPDLLAAARSLDLPLIE